MMKSKNIIIVESCILVSALKLKKVRICASLTEIVAKSLSNSDSMMEVCNLWLKKCQQAQTPPTWHAVAEILDLIGQKTFSKKLLQVYNTGLSI